MKTNYTHRFSVGDLHSTRSVIWRLWAKSKDIYLAVRSKAGLFKISFHGSGVCQIAITSQFAEEVLSQLKLTGQERSMNRWNRPVSTKEEIVIYCLLFPHFYLRPQPSNHENTSDVTWYSQPGEGNMRTFTLSMQRTDAVTRRFGKPVLEWDLPDGETFRLYTAVQAIPDDLLKEFESILTNINASKPVELGEGKLPEGENRVLLFMTRSDGIKFAVDVPVELTYNT